MIDDPNDARPERPGMLVPGTAPGSAMWRPGTQPQAITRPFSSEVPQRPGMLVPGTAPGSAMWRPGSTSAPPAGGNAAPVNAVDAARAAYGLPPQRPGSMVGAGGGMAPPPQRPGPGSRIGVSAADAGKSYDHGLGFGPGLAGAEKRQVGRSMDDPNRTAERLGRLARSTGNLELQMGLLNRTDRQQAGQAGMDLTRERDQAGRAHDMTMFDMHQQAQQARDVEQHQQRLEDWTRNQGAQQQRDEAGRTHDMTMFGLNQGQRAMEHERDRNEQEQDERRRREYGLKPVQAEGTSTPYFQDSKGSIYTGAVPRPTSVEWADVPGTNYSMPHMGGQRVSGMPMFERRPGDKLPPNQAGPTRPGTMVPVAPPSSRPPATTWEKNPLDGKITGGVRMVQNPQTGAWEPQRVLPPGAGGGAAGGGAAASYNPFGG